MSEEIKKLNEEGKKYFEEGNIEKAKEIYTKGIELGSEYSEKQLNELIKK